VNGSSEAVEASKPHQSRGGMALPAPRQEFARHR
jgi:hypothetical protein